MLPVSSKGEIRSNPNMDFAVLKENLYISLTLISEFWNHINEYFPLQRYQKPCRQLPGAYPGGRPPGGPVSVGPSESIILAPWSKVEECRPPINLAPLKFLFMEPCLRLNGRGRSRIFLIEGAPKSRTNRTLAPVGWVQEVSEGDVPPEKWRKNSIFEANSRDLVDSFCLICPHKLRRPISIKNREGASHPWMAPFSSCWFTYLFPFCLLLSYLPFSLFFSFPFFFF